MGDKNQDKVKVFLSLIQDASISDTKILKINKDCVDEVTTPNGLVDLHCHVAQKLFTQ